MRKYQNIFSKKARETINHYKKALKTKNLDVRKPSTVLDIERLDAVIRMVIQI